MIRQKFGNFLQQARSFGLRTIRNLPNLAQGISSNLNTIRNIYSGLNKSIMDSNVSDNIKQRAAKGETYINTLKDFTDKATGTILNVSDALRRPPAQMNV